MIRDAIPANNPTPELFGPWHNLSIVSPRLDMCVIEKIGSKHWRLVQCLMNRPNQTMDDLVRGLPCPEDAVIANSSEMVSSTVFLRDPLERFLSAYLDKCVVAREIDTHCQPMEVFQRSNRLVEGIIDNKRHFFEAYVDTMPLKWNLHFFPQSFYCDGLFRHIQNYDFVGQMGQNFYNDLDRLSQQFPHGRFGAILDGIFELEKNLATSAGNIGVETSASSHVREYYTPATLRRVLEYTAIDYMLLNITIPEWAQQMLNDEV
ncbi:expressed unknown protein [Seminavis robusta]|uniref:Sulfotransferase n=1 Tax=Seminavis robusta TaxID=568900 RepID=A0A9N8E7Y9_9STRA|nr:expressed unknown protein [Seminavis robusta]|eukprot:Sro643_g180350.1 n/a (262) ;mRNA; r:36476-37261